MRLCHVPCCLAEWAPDLLACLKAGSCCAGKELTMLCMLHNLLTHCSLLPDL